MGRIPYVKTEASSDVKALYDSTQKAFGIVFNTVKTVAHRPEIAQAYVPFLGAVLGPGSVDMPLKTLAFLAASKANQCHY